MEQKKDEQNKREGIPMTEESRLEYEQVWITIEQSIQHVMKHGQNI